MKTLLSLLLAGACLLATPAQAQCGYFHDLKAGSRFELTTYDSRDRTTGRIAHEVGTVDQKGGTTTAQMHQQVFDEKDKLISKADYSVECRSGLMRLDLRALFNPQTASAGLGTGATAQVTGDLLELPAELQPGTSLKDASMTAAVSGQGMPTSTTVITVTNRKVEALEPQTTPAGTFKCAKISQDMEVRMGIGRLSIPMSLRTVEWYAPGVGAVRSETYRKNKLVSYSLLTTKPQ
jgi:hypothetical protein